MILLGLMDVTSIFVSFFANWWVLDLTSISCFFLIFLQNLLFFLHGACHDVTISNNKFVLSTELEFKINFLVNSIFRCLKNWTDTIFTFSLGRKWTTFLLFLFAALTGIAVGIFQFIGEFKYNFSLYIDGGFLFVSDFNYTYQTNRPMWCVCASLEWEQ
jgi:hypothetical protein